MQCTHCGHALSNNSAICPNCGMLMTPDQLKMRKDFNGYNNPYVERLNKLNQNLVELERQIADTNAKKTMILERKKLNSNNDATLNNVLNLKEEILSIGKNINSLEDEIKALNSKKDELKTTLDSIDNEELILRKNYVPDLSLI